MLLDEIRKDIEPEMLPLFDKAVEIATKAHEGQTDKSGKPYIGHVMRVSLGCKTQKSKVVALLHDVIEDTDVTLEQMEELGFSEYIIKAVLCLTHQEGESYEDFIKRAAKNPIAREVRIADLEDNMDVRRLCEVTEKDFVRMDKYLSAWKYLKSYVK
jgi:(p)ppGpp synthase/HD superfamily hydrolase